MFKPYKPIKLKVFSRMNFSVKKTSYLSFMYYICLLALQVYNFNFIKFYCSVVFF